MKDLLCAILSSSALTLFLRAFREDSKNRYGILLGNYIACTALAFFTSQNKSSLPALSRPAIILALFAGLFYLLGLLAIQSSISKNGAALTSAFSKLGMLVTLALSVAVFHERLSLCSVFGILLAVVAILAVNHDPKKQNGQAPLLLFLTLLVNGTADCFAKLFESFCSPHEENGTLFLLFLSAAILTFLLSVRKRRISGTPVSGKAFFSGILAGIPNYYSSVFLIHALTALPAVFVYPFFSVGTILCVTAFAVFLFHEQLNAFQKAGMALVILSLVFLNL